jgi:hypothetical protein
MCCQCEDAKCDRMILAPWLVIIAGPEECGNSLGGGKELSVKRDTD